MKQRLYCFIILSFVFSIQGCGEKIDPGTTAGEPKVIKGVSIRAVRMTDQPVIYEAVGTVTAGISSVLSSKLLGAVEEIRVREGDQVKKGDVLIVQDQRQVKAGVRQAEAGLAESRKALTAAISARDAARSERELAFTTQERYLELKKKKLVSVQASDEVEARYSQAKAAMERAEAMVDAAGARVRQVEAALASVRVTGKDAVITAPHDGIITGKLVDRGDLATPGKPLLTLETTRGFCVDMIMPETYIDHVKPLQEVIVIVPALKTGPLKGNVCTIVPSADQRSRSFVVKINLPVDMEVRSGHFARVQIPTGTVGKFLIPRISVIVHGQLSGLYMVDADNIARFRLVRTGRTFGDSVEILSGLKEGDRYVLNPTPTVQDGVRLEVSP